MASLHRHSARARSCLPSTGPSAAASFPLRSRSIHATTRLGAGNDGGEPPNKTGGSKPRAPLRSVALNQATFNAIRAQGSSGPSNSSSSSSSSSSPSSSSDSVRNTVNNFVGRDARHLASSSPATGVRPLRARRTGPSQPAQGRVSGGPGRTASGQLEDDYEVAAPRRVSFGGGRGGRGGRMGGRGRARGGGGGRRGRRTLYQEDDGEDMDMDSMENAGESADVDFKEEPDAAPIFTPALADLLSDLSNPAELLSDLDNLNLTDKERQYVLDRVAESRRPDPYEPRFDLADLVGLGPRTPSGGADNPLGAADTLHQALSKATPLGGGKGSDLNTPAMAAESFQRGETVFLRDAAAARSFETFLDGDKTEGGSSNNNKKINTPGAEDRAKVNGYLVAGRYAPPGSLAPKNASDTVKDVYRILAKNGGYIETEEKSLASKIAAMLPSARPAPTTAAGGGSGGKPKASTSGKGGTQAKEAVKA